MFKIKNTARRLYGQGERKAAQVSLEFMFGMIGVVLLLVGMIQVFAWTGQDLISRIDRHNAVLVEPIDVDSVHAPLQQVRPIAATSTEIDAAVNSNIFGEENP